MSKLKTKQVIATGLSALMMMFSVTSVFAAEPDSKSNTLNYEVSSRYDWMIHSTIDFGEDAGTNKTIDRTGNGVKVLKNVIPEGKYLNISVKGSGGTVMTPSELKTLDIEGTKYVVLEERENNQALVMTTSNIGSREFQTTLGPYGEPIARHDGKNNSTYENSTIDNYLENEWYNSLSSKMKVAIQPANIK